MSREIARLVDEFYLGLVREKRPRKVEDDYSGGEMHLNAKIVLESATRRFNVCSGLGVDYSWSLTTNGTLLKPSLVSRFKEVGLKRMRVSLAGPARIHDLLRPDKDNRKTYERIVRNLEAVSGLVPIVILTQYDSSCLDFMHIPEMMDQLKARGIEIENYSFAPISPKRGRSEFQCGMGDPEVSIFLMKEARRRGFPQFTAAPSSACAFDFRARMVFDADGSMIPCAALNPGELAHGHPGKGGIDFETYAQMVPRKFPDECLNGCELFPACLGGCRLPSLAACRRTPFSGCRVQLYHIWE